MSEERKIWKVINPVPIRELEDTLNELANDGYHLHSKDLVKEPVGSLGSTMVDFHYVVTAFDPALLGAKQAQGMTSAWNAAMGVGTK